MDEAAVRLADFIDRRTLAFGDLRATCRTLGDLKRLIDRRYAGFGEEIAALGAQIPSVERFEKVCAALRGALEKSYAFQDPTALMSPHFIRAFDLLCRRPKTLGDGEGAVLPLLFDDGEVWRIVSAGRAAFGAFRRLADATGGDADAFGLNFGGLPKVREFGKMSPKERARAILFTAAERGRWLFSERMLLMARPMVYAEARVFIEWERAGAALEEVPLELLFDREFMATCLKFSEEPWREAVKAGNGNALVIGCDEACDRIMMPQQRSRQETAALSESEGCPRTSTSAGDERPETREIGRFTVDEYAHRVVYTDHDHPKFERYEFYRKKTRRGTSAFEAVRQLMNDYKAGQRQTRNSTNWKGAFQDGENRGDAHRFMKEQVFRLPRWSTEKGRFIRGQFEGKWRLWTDDEMKLSEDERMRRFIDEHPRGLPKKF